MANSNRYPVQGAARDYRRLPREERRYPRPDNDNDPNRPRPRPRKPRPLIPANDNRPVPKVGDWSQPRPPRLPGWARWLSRFMRLYPLIGAALTLWELYELYQYYQKKGVSSSDYVFCHEPNIPPGVHKPKWMHAPGFCGDQLPHAPGTGEWTPGSPWWVDYIEYPNAIHGKIWYPHDSRKFDSNPGTPPVEDDVPVIFPRPWIDPDYPGIWEDPFPDPLKPDTPFPRPKPPQRPDPRNRPDDRTRPDPRLPPRPRLPEDRVSEEPTFRPKPDWRTEPYPRRPPPRERERKLRIRDLPNQRLRRTLGWLLSAASEGGDFLDIMYGALPDNLQNDDANMSEKFQTVFANLDKVDFDEFVSELWQNEVQDRYFGKGFKDMTSALEEFGLELPSLKI